MGVFLAVKPGGGGGRVELLAELVVAVEPDAEEAEGGRNIRMNILLHVLASYKCITIHTSIYRHQILLTAVCDRYNCWQIKFLATASHSKQRR